MKKVPAKLTTIGKAILYLEQNELFKADGAYLDQEEKRDGSYIWVAGWVEGPTLGLAIINLAKDLGWNGE